MAASPHRRDSTSARDKWRPASEQCPMCGGNNTLTPVAVDGDVLLYVCNECDHTCGIDDSTDDQLLAAMIVAECLDVDGRPQSDVPFSSNIRVRIVTCDRCGNEDNNLLRHGGYDKKKRCLLIECLECDNQIELALDVIDDDGLDQITETSSDGDLDGNFDDADETTSIVAIGDAHELSDKADDCQLMKSFHAASVADVDEDDRRQWAWRTICRGCGNDNFDLFRKEFDPETGRLVIAQCFACDFIEDYGSESHLTNDSSFTSVADEVFDSQHVLRQPSHRQSAHRHQSERRSYSGADRHERRKRHWTRKDTTGSLRRQSIKTRRERIADLGQLKRGDHVAWHRWYAVWHHAIVIEVDRDGLKLTVIHNSGAPKILNGKLASVRLEIVDADPKNGELYRYVYEAALDSSGDKPAFYSPDEVVERAASRLGQTYNPLKFNCEHFAKWCKLGRKMSEQVKGYFIQFSFSFRVCAREQYLSNNFIYLSLRFEFFFRELLSMKLSCDN
jgi:hypothetical protein